MPDHVFSAARLRGYRVLEAAGLSDAVSLQVLNTVVAGRLWLPFSLIEIAFRNAADQAIAGAHAAGENWLTDAGHDEGGLRAAAVVAPTILHGRRSDGSREDPVADAARMAASQLGREIITRDDLIAHLMLGFWVHRCPEALEKGVPPIRAWELIAARLPPPLDDASHLQRTMIHLLRTRNRVAHHESLLFRAKHVFTRRGDAKAGADLVTSLQGAVAAFKKDVELVVATATAFAPMAEKHIESVPDQVVVEIASFEAALAAERLRLREQRDARLAAREAARVTRFAGEGEV